MMVMLVIVNIYGSWVGRICPQCYPERHTGGNQKGFSSSPQQSLAELSFEVILAM